MLCKITLFFASVRYLKPMQAWFFFQRRVLGPRKITPPRGATLAFSQSLKPSFPETNDSLSEFNREFTFLNQTLPWEQCSDWEPAHVSRLWRYNLHYFDYLNAPAVSERFKAELIDSWILRNPQLTTPAWEPYTVSLRIINWCKHFSRLESSAIPEFWLRSLHEQALWLRRHMEHHILANHYFENLRALAFSGSFLSSDESARWRRYAGRELVNQLEEQFLDDGGHYERSPQYHCAVLSGCLDILNICNQDPSLFGARVAELLQGRIRNGLCFLNQIANPSGEIPLLGDSAFGAAPNLRALSEYARELGLVFSDKQESLFRLPQSGISGYRHVTDWLVFDCGDIGPSYQPGHTHSDCLSFMLDVAGSPLIVDTGVSEYEPGEIRDWVRSTAAHNTVTIDNTNQSQLWGEFRVGKRAQVLSSGCTTSPTQVSFFGSFKGFYELPGSIEHSRRINVKLNSDQFIDQLEILDQISGSDTRDAIRDIASRVYLHPDVRAEALSRNEILLVHPSGEQWVFSHDASLNHELAEGWYCPEFGKKIRNTAVVISKAASLPFDLSFNLRRA